MTTPTATDLRIASLVHAAAATLRGPTARFGDRKVFISALWNALKASGNNPWPDSPIDAAHSNFNSWLLRALLLHDATGAPLILLARADLVAAMPAQAVAASEIVDRGAVFHFVIDRAADPAAYAPRPTSIPWSLPSDARRGRIGGGR